MIVIRRRSPAERMARFYALAVQPALPLGGANYSQKYSYDLVREWGRIGSPGVVRLDPFPTEDAALEGAKALARAKGRRGYA